jgi:hypothetical protein
MKGALSTRICISLPSYFSISSLVLVCLPYAFTVKSAVLLHKVCGPPGARLCDVCVSPEDLLTDPHKHLNANYYISKQINPAIARCFDLLGADIVHWYTTMSKPQVQVSM